jgi:DNA-directed RNA polymerase subunit RPC12/RpoP
MVERNVNVKMRCGRCSQQVALNEMKYAKDGKTLICRQCRGVSVQEHAAEQKKMPTSPFESKKPEGSTYLCTSCNYNFTRKNIAPERCPYCGKPTVVERGTITSRKLLDES